MTGREKKLNVEYSAVLSLYWMIFSVSSIFMVPLLRSRGFGDTAVGALIALRSLSAICVSPLIARFSDRFPAFQIKHILSILATLCIADSLFFYASHAGLLMTGLVFAVLGATTNTMTPLHNAMAIRFNRYGDRVVFSVARGIGSFSYAVASLALGKIVGENQPERSLPILAGLMVLSIVALQILPGYRIPLDNVRAKEKDAHSNVYLLRTYPRFTLFLASSVFIFVGYCMCNSFMIDIVTSRGGDNFDMGVSCFILGAVELPTALLFQRLKRRFGVRALLNFSSVFALVKMIGLYLSPTVGWLFFSQTFQMLGNGMYWFASMYYVEETIDPVDQAKGQALTIIASINIGNIVGTSISGFLLNYFDIYGVTLFGCICTAVGVVLMFPAMRNVRDANVYKR